MNTKLCLNDGPLPQDLTEGVDPDEWVNFYSYSGQSVLLVLFLYLLLLLLSLDLNI